MCTQEVAQEVAQEVSKNHYNIKPIVHYHTEILHFY